jgi:hypothetical protein
MRAFDAHGVVLNADFSRRCAFAESRHICRATVAKLAADLTSRAQ